MWPFEATGSIMGSLQWGFILLILKFRVNTCLKNICNNCLYIIIFVLKLNKHCL